jgi:hypothetical protein
MTMHETRKPMKTISIRWDRRLEVDILRYARKNNLKFSQAVRMLATRALRHEQEIEQQEVFTARGW